MKDKIGHKIQAGDIVMATDDFDYTFSKAVVTKVRYMDCEVRYTLSNGRHYNERKFPHQMLWVKGAGLNVL